MPDTERTHIYSNFIILKPRKRQSKKIDDYRLLKNFTFFFTTKFKKINKIWWKIIPHNKTLFVAFPVIFFDNP